MEKDGLQPDCFYSQQGLTDPSKNDKMCAQVKICTMHEQEIAWMQSYIKNSIINELFFFPLSLPEKYDYVGRLLKPGDEPSEYTDEEDMKDHQKHEWSAELLQQLKPRTEKATIQNC